MPIRACPSCQPANDAALPYCDKGARNSMTVPYTLCGHAHPTQCRRLHISRPLPADEIRIFESASRGSRLQDGGAVPRQSNAYPMPMQVRFRPFLPLPKRTLVLRMCPVSGAGSPRGTPQPYRCLGT
jgi:hypothetical protein